VQKNVRAGLRVVALAVIPLLALGGCAMDEVEFNGGLFNMVGLGSQSKKSKDPQVATRAPIVIPPTLTRIPPPGVPVESASPEVAALADPDKIAKVSKAELERQQREYCEVHYHDAKARGDHDAESVEGPLGPCRASVLTAVKKWTESE
jgi:hypothetical protein